MWEFDKVKNIMWSTKHPEVQLSKEDFYLKLDKLLDKMRKTHSWFNEKQEIQFKYTAHKFLSK